MLSDLLLAAPHRGQLPFVTSFLLAVHVVLDDGGQRGEDTPAAADIAALMRSAAEQGSGTALGATALLGSAD